MATFTNPDGLSIELDPATVDDLKALSLLTRQPENALLADAVERLRQGLLPSTKPPAARPGRKPKTS